LESRIFLIIFFEPESVNSISTKGNMASKDYQEFQSLLENLFP